MNLQEFAALKAGDKIENIAFGNHAMGEITEVRQDGVKVCWLPGTSPFFYSVAGTAWFHWSKADDVNQSDGTASTST